MNKVAQAIANLLKKGKLIAYEDKQNVVRFDDAKHPNVHQVKRWLSTQEAIDHLKKQED